MADHSTTSPTFVLDIIDRYQHELYRYCNLLTRSKWDADDLVQETLIKLFSLGKKADVSINKAYVFRTATNTWIDICRKRKVIIKELRDEQDIAAIGELDAFELQDSLELLLERLPVSQATILLLMDVFQFNAKETAEMLNVTEGAVKATLHRARAGIRKCSQTEHDQTGRSNTGSSARPKLSPTGKPDQLIAQFVKAFIHHDPYAISLAYLELKRNEIEVGYKEKGERLYFRFRDPEGNLCIIESEIIF